MRSTPSLSRASRTISAPVILAPTFGVKRKAPASWPGSLRLAGRRVRRPDLTVATMDHNTPARGGRAAADEIGRRQLDALEENCRRAGIRLYELGSRHQGIVHVIGPDLGLTQPGMVIVC